MKLDTYLVKHKIGRAAFGRLIDASPPYITQLCDFKFWPGKKTMLKILEVTNGAVTPNDLLGVEIKDFKSRKP
jgi:hypothetical protein